MFIELVIWGMFRFMAHSEVLFAQGQTHPMAAQQPPLPDESGVRPAEHARGESGGFPEPRLQTNDAGEMNQFLNSEQEMLNPEAAVHRTPAGRCTFRFRWRCS